MCYSAIKARQQYRSAHLLVITVIFIIIKLRQICLRIGQAMYYKWNIDINLLKILLLSI